MSVDPNKQLYSIYKQGTFYVAFDIVINFIIIEYNYSLILYSASNQIFVLPSHTRARTSYQNVQRTLVKVFMCVCGKGGLNSCFPFVSL